MPELPNRLEKIKVLFPDYNTKLLSFSNVVNFLYHTNALHAVLIISS